MAARRRQEQAGPRRSRRGSEGRGGQESRPAGPPVLVVLCDVAPAALQKKAFDKLLDANGVTGHRQPQRRGLAYGGAGCRRPAIRRQQRVEGEAGHAKGGLSATPETEAAEPIYVEATPAQVKAVLAGLAAQPEVFVAVSAEPVEGRRAEEIVRQYQYARRGRARFKSGLGGGGSRARTIAGTDGAEPSGRQSPPSPKRRQRTARRPSKLPAPRPSPPPPAAAPPAPGPSPAAAGGERKQAGPAPKARAMEQGEAESAGGRGQAGREPTTTAAAASAVRPVRPAATGAVRVAGRRRPAAHRAEGFGQGEA